MEHAFLPSGWCICGHHRDDGRNERDEIEHLDIASIRQLLGPTYEPKAKRS